MRQAAEILLQHEIQGKDSCIAWAVEFVAKLHDKIPPTEYPIQSALPSGMGFGKEASNVLDKYGITAWDESLEWDDFERVSKEDAAKGLNLVFTLPSAVNLDLIAAKFAGRTYHGCVALHHPALPYATRALGTGHFPVSAKQMYYFVRRHIEPHYCLHCLRHKPKPDSAP